MRNGICTGIAVVAGLSCVAPGARAAGRNDSAVVTETAPTPTAGAVELPQEGSRPLASDRTTRTTHAISLDWGSGGLALWGHRTRAGRKPEHALAIGRAWHKTVSAGLSGWHAISPDLGFAAGARIARTKSSSAASPAWHTSVLSQEAFVALEGPAGTGVRVAIFDESGWSPGSLGDSPNRMVNGEKRARKGTAIELGLLESTRFDPGKDQTKLAFRLERATSPLLGTETAVTLAWKVKF